MTPVRRCCGRLWRWLWPLGLLILAGTAHPQTARPGVSQAVLAAEALSNRGKHREALAAFKLIVKDNPTDPLAPVAQLGVAEETLALGEVDAAARLFDDLQARQQRGRVRGGVLLGLAGVELRRDRPRRGQSLVEAALPLLVEDPHRLPAAHFVRAECLREQKRFQMAREALGRVGRWPKSRFVVAAAFAFARTWLDEGKKQEAAQALHEAGSRYTASPQAPGAVFQAAGLFAELKQWPAAINSYQRFLGRYAEHRLAPAAQLGTAEAYLAQGEREAALATLQGLLTVYVRSPEAGVAHVRIGDIRFGGRDFLGAARQYRQSPSSALGPEGLRRKGEAELRAGLAESAVKTLDAASKALKGEPSMLALLRRVEALIQTGELDAAKALRQQLAGGPLAKSHADELALVEAELLLAQREYDAARAIAQRIIDASKDAAIARRARLTLARVELQRGRHPAAVKRAADLLASDPGPDLRPAVLLVLGTGQARLRDDQAVDTLERVVRESPGSGEAVVALRELADLHRLAGRDAPASEAEARLARLYPEAANSTVALVRRADTERQAGRPEQARSLYLQYLRQGGAASYRQRARAGLAIIAAGEGDVKTVGEQVKALVAERPTATFSAQLQWEVGRAYRGRRLTPAALAAYAKATEFDAQSPAGLRAALARGSILLELEDFSAAAAVLRPALAGASALSPADQAEAWYDLATALRWLHRRREAAVALRRVLAASPLGKVAVAAAFDLGEFQYAAGEFAAARDRYQQVMDAGEEVPAARKWQATFRRACCLQELGAHDEALRSLQRLIADPNGGSKRWNARLRVAVALEGLSRQNEALDSLEALITDLATATPQDEADPALEARARLQAGRLALRERQPTEAVRWLRRAARPRWGETGVSAVGLLAKAYLASDEFGLAATTFERLVSAFRAPAETRAEALYQAGEAWARADRQKLARSAWRRVLDRYPDSAWAQRARDRLGQ